MGASNKSLDLIIGYRLQAEVFHLFFVGLSASSLSKMFLLFSSATSDTEQKIISIFGGSGQNTRYHAQSFFLNLNLKASGDDLLHTGR